MQTHEEIEAQRPHTRLDREADRAAPDLKAALTARGPALTPAAIMHLQRTAGNAGVEAMLAEERAERSPVKDVIESGGGNPLDRDTRSVMEDRLGADFSDVRVHTDEQASDSAASVNAHAYTVGKDIVFQSGRFDPATTTGQRMLAHELTHVVQQRSGPVDGTPTEGGIKLSHPQDRFEQEAERTADRVMSGEAPAVAASAPAAVQRQEEEEETAQGMFVQRQAAGEEEEEETAQGMFVQRQAAGEEEEEEAAPGVQALAVQREAPDEEEEEAG
jgi:hypothetical protein